MRRILIAVSFALLTFAPSVRAQEHIQVTLVEVPVNVVNRNGAAIRDLKVENFELYDDGQRRAITHFDAIDLSAGAKRESAELPAGASRNFLLLFDRNGVDPKTLAKAQMAARTFISNSGVTGDLIAVGAFSTESGFRLLTAFTNDKTLLTAAIDSVGAPSTFQPVDPLLLSSIEMRQAAASVGNDKTGVAAETAMETAHLIEQASNDAQRAFIRRTLDGYAAVARLLDRVPGRKQVILLSAGFDAKLLGGRESLSSTQAHEEQAQIERGESWRVDTDNRFGNTSTGEDLKEMIDVCHRADVVLNAIDIKGLRSGADVVEGAPTSSTESLFLLTHDTGGMVFKNTNSLDDDFRRLLQSQEVEYILAFEAPSNAPGKFHKLSVKLVDVPAARALSRAGYFESSPADTPVARVLTASEIVTEQIAQSDLPVRTLATPFPRRDGRAQVPVIVEIDGRSLLAVAHGNQIQSEVFLYAFDDHGTVRDFVHQPLGLDVAKLRDRLQSHGVRVYETLMLPPGRYSVRTLVRAGAKPLYGYYGTTIDVPSYDQVAILGGSAIDESPGDWVAVKPPDRSDVPHEYPFLIDGAMLVPAAAPIIRKGAATRVGLYVGHLAAEHVTVAGTIDGHDTSIKIASRATSPDGTGRLLIEFVAPELPAGEHRLTLRVSGVSPLRDAVVPFVIR